jgi:hypothetical protein
VLVLVLLLVLLLLVLEELVELLLELDPLVRLLPPLPPLPPPPDDPLSPQAASALAAPATQRIEIQVVYRIKTLSYPALRLIVDAPQRPDQASWSEPGRKLRGEARPAPGRARKARRRR